VIAALVAGAVLLIVFVTWEARTADAMMPPDLFRIPAFSGANAMTLLLYSALNGALFFLPFNLMQVQGYTATQAGAAFLPFTILVGGLSRYAGRLSDRYGARGPLVMGPVVVAFGFAGLAVPGIGGSYWSTFFPGLVVIGLGMAVSVAPLTTVVMNAVADARAGVASGVNNAASRVAGLLAIAVLGTVAVSTFSGELDRRLAVPDVPSAEKEVVWASRQDLAAASVPATAGPGIERQLRSAVDASFVASYRPVIGVCAGLALLSAACAALTIPGRPPDR